MEIYLVGGAVRDELLGREPAERDWVVVGATPAAMRAKGFRQVGRDFPVFLHPRTGEEHALARTERNTGPGHADFECRADPDVTLPEDLARRDLTINAMARDGDTVIDPYGGRQDLAARLLRHVSPAFAEDPLRVFRVARFAALLPGFAVADETLALMREMRGTLPALSAERVWREWRKAAAAPRPDRFFAVVETVGATGWFDELDLAATVRLLRRCPFVELGQTLAAPGWASGHDAVAAVYGRLRAERLVLRAATSLAKHGRTLAATEPEPTELLGALLAIDAFRQGPLSELVLATAERCAGHALPARRRLIDELRTLRVAAAPGAEYGSRLRDARIARIRDAIAGASSESRDAGPVS